MYIGLSKCYLINTRVQTSFHVLGLESQQCDGSLDDGRAFVVGWRVSDGGYHEGRHKRPENLDEWEPLPDRLTSLCVESQDPATYAADGRHLTTANNARPTFRTMEAPARCVGERQLQLYRKGKIFEFYHTQGTTIDNMLWTEELRM